MEHYLGPDDGDMLEFLLEDENVIIPAEIREFLESLQEWFDDKGSLTFGQSEALEKIYNRHCE